MARYVVGITGASGIILALKTIDALLAKGFEVELILSQNAFYTASFELGKEFSSPKKFLSKLSSEGVVRLHGIQDVGASVCSGSYLTDGMIIIPCSMATLAAIAHGLADNTLRRSADVTLKEKRPLIIVPRESPLSEIHLENMLRLARMGVAIVPPMPAWYSLPQTLEDVENTLVGKVLDLLKIENTLSKRWG